MYDTTFDIKFLADCKEQIPQLANLWFEEISKQWVPNSSVEKATNNLHLHAQKNALPLTYVALKNNKAVGMASLREDDGLGAHYTPWLGTLITDPNNRGQKIGEQLINKIKSHAKQLNHKHLYLLAFDLTIPKWYTRLGWQKIEMDKLFQHPVTVMKITL